ncbi:NAD(P)H dehydrogenase B2 isoform 1 [Hibiscus syriacus]|uniref:NAD(P)H dehydrogenase B2 isoform 1 n=1 Tax=Hibiscus syriacus TaxID=106335 RepID=A0A6A3CZG1_HIBSY|nr:uncharacterized protein LOC120137050 [Hibiscus syriacus]KAE8732489.1 NAD(P)H dehydrogenase B2 isoform 1 [Hibiscus syriacus]
MVYPTKTITNDPLFSCIITLSMLILLYFPHRFSLLFSPVLVLSASLLLSLLRFGASQRIQTEKIIKGSVARVAELEEEEEESAPVELKWTTCKNEPNLIVQSFEERFVEWDVRAPLEVIYEEFEEGDEEAKDPNLNLDPTRGIERYPSLALYYPESDSDSSSGEEMDFPAIGKWVPSVKMGYRWEEEDREGLIELELDEREVDFRGEDDNLIEIDIS